MRFQLQQPQSADAVRAEMDRRRQIVSARCIRRDNAEHVSMLGLRRNEEQRVTVSAGRWRLTCCVPSYQPDSDPVNAILRRFVVPLFSYLFYLFNLSIHSLKE